jgi:hypothetical protein
VSAEVKILDWDENIRRLVQKKTFQENFLVYKLSSNKEQRSCLCSVSVNCSAVTVKYLWRKLYIPFSNFTTKGCFPTSDRPDGAKERVDESIEEIKAKTNLTLLVGIRQELQNLNCANRQEIIIPSMAPITPCRLGRLVCSVLITPCRGQEKFNNFWRKTLAPRQFRRVSKRLAASIRPVLTGGIPPVVMKEGWDWE